MNTTQKQYKEKLTLVFLPGWGFNSSIWKPIAANLLDYNILFCELPTLEDYTTHSLHDISAIIETLLPQNSVLVAWSFSGMLAAFICHQFPNKISQLITVASIPKMIATIGWPGVNPRFIARFHTEACTNFPRLMQKFYSLLNADNAMNFDEQNQTKLLFYLNILMRIDVRVIYATLNLPILHIFGDNDPIIPFACATHIAQYYLHHRTCIIHGAGHIPFQSHTNEFLIYLTQFLHHEY
jgi:pimeloyl-[acyl-carrier protein] methyl ester esterase